MNAQINGIVVVEGPSDTAKLRSIFGPQLATIETGGNQISRQTFNLIRLLAQRGKLLILFLDPDGPGEGIRRRVIQALDGFPYGQCFLKRSDIPAGKKKIGVAEATPSAVKTALANYLVYTPGKESISLTEFDSLHLDTKLRRQHLCDRLGMGYANQKQLWKRLNMLGLTKADVEALLNENIC